MCPVIAPPTKSKEPCKAINDKEAADSAQTLDRSKSLRNNGTTGKLKESPSEQKIFPWVVFSNGIEPSVKDERELLSADHQTPFPQEEVKASSMPCAVYFNGKMVSTREDTAFGHPQSSRKLRLSSEGHEPLSLSIHKKSPRRQKKLSRAPCTTTCNKLETMFTRYCKISDWQRIPPRKHSVAHPGYRVELERRPATASRMHIIGRMFGKHHELFCCTRSNLRVKTFLRENVIRLALIDDIGNISTLSSMLSD